MEDLSQELAAQLTTGGLVYGVTHWLSKVGYWGIPCS